MASHQNYGQQPQQPAVVVQATGNCPNCRVGFINENFTTCGIIWAICCFPCGLICLLTQKEKKCSHCGFVRQ
ncbi:membrane protein BRI3-like [Oratosquilla oratoria]|uniref:membrane protein BRI3-like n=1 Tax=Oratosquilla oratoria TaxID=337810 RepID=UPI003F76B7E9